MNDTTVRPLHVRTGKSGDPAHLLSGGGVSQVILFATFVVAVDGVGFNFNRHFSPSVYVVVDTKLFDPFLSMCDQS